MGLITVSGAFPPVTISLVVPVNRRSGTRIPLGPPCHTRRAGDGADEAGLHLTAGIPGLPSVVVGACPVLIDIFLLGSDFQIFYESVCA